MSLSSFNATGEDEYETCLSRLAVNGGVHNNSSLNNSCGVVWDGFNCWGPALPGSTVYTACPAAKGMDVSKQAYRYCGASGHWFNKDGLPDQKGWTNYTPCFTPEIFALLKRLHSGSESDAVSKIAIAKGTRILELVGLSLSFMALLLSLFVFCYFRSLRNPRTRLHRNLFVAMVIQVAVRLTLYIDQVVVRTNLNENPLSVQQYSRGIDNTPILCEAAYICLEYARTAMFMWMFVEGLYLHSMITVTVFEEKLSPRVHTLVGWVFPIPLTLAWAVVTAKHYGTATCWWGYNFTIYFWILEGPRLGVLLVNLGFLLNILRVLVTKLRQSNSSEAHQARKAVKAALVLLPLLGLTNIVNILDAPLERSAIVFGFWSYITHILTSCQGLILACLYCFWNGEVQLALKKFVRYKILKGSKHPSAGAYNKCPVQMSPLSNNKSVVKKNGVPSEPKEHCIQVLKSHGTGPKSQLYRLNPVRSSSVDARLRVPVKAGTTLRPITSENNILLKHTKSEVNAAASYSSIQLFKNSTNSVDFCKRQAGKLGKLSKLRIWMSPLAFVNKSGKQSPRQAMSPIMKSLPECESSSEIPSTEGCHFQIEYYNAGTGISCENVSRNTC